MSQERPKYDSNSKTFVYGLDDFSFETLEAVNGHATVIRFPLDQPNINAGDVVVILSGTDIHFHGMISHIESGKGVASDKRGSLLPSTTVQ
jgi:hypothetical protein